jgi:acetoin utilization deacetylase AcuC-like enzyme
MNKAKTGIVRHPKYLEHRTGSFHPESHKRLEVIYAMLDAPEMAGIFTDVSAKPIERDHLMRAHTAAYIDRIAATAGKASCSLDPDTSTSAGSYEAALLAAGGLCEAVSKVMTGALDNAFALVRPPGHHALRSRAMGFCLFNNVAVAAKFAQAVHGAKRVLIVDWDLHHGNGTQDTFEEDPSVLYFSTHQFPYYPGSGAFQEVGRGPGSGYTLNVPLPPGQGDGEYAAVFERILKPVAGEYRPDLVLVSAGFDIHENDPLGGMQVTPRGFAALTRALMEIAEASCGGRMVITLEGGYDLDGLRESVKAVLKEMAGRTMTSPHEAAVRANQRTMATVTTRVAEVHRRFWPSLGLLG